jgi:hypothetical protein
MKPHRQIIIVATTALLLAACAGSTDAPNKGLFSGERMSVEGRFSTDLSGKALGKCFDRCKAFSSSACESEKFRSGGARFNLDFGERNAEFLNSAAFNSVRKEWAKLYKKCHR